MRETLKVVVLSTVGGVLAGVVSFGISRLRQWGATRFRVLLALNVMASMGGVVAFLYIAWDSISHGIPLPTGGSVVVVCGFLVLPVCGYFLGRELVISRNVRITLARIDAILRERDKHLAGETDLAEALGRALKAVHSIVSRNGPFFDAGEWKVDKSELEVCHRNGKETTRYAVTIGERLRTALQKSPFESYSIASDEIKYVTAKANFMWVIDPIDGSRHLARNLPLLTTSIALVKDEQPLVSVVYAPVTNELFFAVRGKGAYLNAWANHLHVSRREMKDALIHVEFPNRDLTGKFADDFAKQCGTVSRIFSEAYRVRGLGLGSLGLAYVAKGCFDAYVTFSGTTLKNDVYAGLLLVEEAGGQVVTFPVPRLREDSIRVLAANPQIFDSIRAMISSSRPPGART